MTPMATMLTGNPDASGDHGAIDTLTAPAPIDGEADEDEPDRQDQRPVRRRIAAKKTADTAIICEELPDRESEPSEAAWLSSWCRAPVEPPLEHQAKIQSTSTRQPGSRGSASTTCPRRKVVG